MALKEDVQNILNTFDAASSDDIVDVLNRIRDHLQNNLTRDYLDGKIQVIRVTDGETERKNLCKNLVPYLDWYMQGS